MALGITMGVVPTSITAVKSDTLLPEIDNPAAFVTPAPVSVARYVPGVSVDANHAVATLLPTSYVSEVGVTVTPPGKVCTARSASVRLAETSSENAYLI